MAGSIPAPVSSNYCEPAVAHFVIDQKVLTWSFGKFAIHDSQGNVVFNVEGKHDAKRLRRVLRDPSGKAICLMRQKLMSLHNTWGVYQGENENESSLLFTMAKTSCFSFKPSFGVFLGNKESQSPDFIVRGDFLQHKFTISYGDAPAAEVRNKTNAASLLGGKDQYDVTVNPGVDHAFIVAVMVIIDQVIQLEKAVASSV